MTEKEKQLYKDRLKKLEGLRSQGIDPYPATANRTDAIGQALEKFASLTKSKKKISLTGRIRAIRMHGALTFGNLEDESGSIQFLLKADEMAAEEFELFNKYFDIGDFLEVTGSLFETKRGEKTLLVSDYKLLTKSLKALPEKWHGLQELEARLRKRYLDMLAVPATKEIFRKKAAFWKSVRDFLNEEGFLEVETPTLESMPGGADAEPFITHYNALDKDFYLRISLELPLKKLLIGGFEKVFEIGRIFRNEGISSEHLQDYTQMEFYWAYADFDDLKKFVQKFYRKIIKDVFNATKIKNGGIEIDWGKTWKEYDFYEYFKKFTGLDLAIATEDDLQKKANTLEIKYEKYARRGRLIDLIFKKVVRSKLVDPGFLVYPPVEIEPLAKRWPKDLKRVQRLQVMAWGTELGKGFAELNDPIDQKARFEEQMKLREAGDKEAQRLDEEFLEALEYGMPPTAGFGFSERLFAVLMDKSIRATVIFPPMKEEKHE